MDALQYVFSDPKNIVYLVSIVAIIGLVYYLYKKYELTKYQLMIFILLVVFWSSINIIRAYRKTYAMSPMDVGGLGLDAVLAANVAAAYGFISIFVRLPFFALSDYFRSRKFFIGLSLVFIAVSSVVVVIDPTYISLLSSSLALGLGASLLAMFNVMFAETFTKEQALVSVSILSVAPLLAEFCVAPLQYLATSQAFKNYDWLWMISAGLALIAFVLLLFIKDNKSKTRNFSTAKFLEVCKDTRFLTLCSLGVLVSFIKFGSSGANVVAYARSEIIAMDPLAIAYTDVVFSMFQLIAGVLMGIYLKKKIGVRNTLLLGIGLSLCFILVVTFSTSAPLIFLTYALNGFGYGLTYNCLLGLAMQPFAKDYREISMGIYQTLFAIGIFYGDKIYAIIAQSLPEGFLTFNPTQSVFFVFLCVCLLTMALIVGVFHKGNTFLES
ncbi:MAG: MFS transporter [Erysipelotrichaceae bacterium]